VLFINKIIAELRINMKAIENRRSIRKYKDQPIDEKMLLEIIRNASLVPSGNNTQPWNYIIVDNLETRKEISIVCHNQKWMNTAPVLLYVLQILSVE
jgi:nitroreductase